MTSIKRTMKKSNDDSDDDMINGGRNRFKGLPIIYKMASNEQTMVKRKDDSDDDMINGGKNRFKELPSIYKMTSIKQTMKKSNGGKNRFKELPSIYKMSSNKQTMKKRDDDVDVSANLLDSLVPDINVPIMKPSRGAWFKNWIQNAKCKMHEASETIKKRSMEISNWILNKRIVKSHLPAKIKDLIKMVMGTEYFEKPLIHKYFEEKLSAKKNHSFQK